jgi:hypothetical protein
MTHPTDHDPAHADPAQAFEALRGEIIRLSRLVDHLGSLPDRTPDYSPTLADMTRALKSILGALTRIEQSPAVQVTHEVMHEKIVELSQTIRAEDRQMLLRAHETIMQSVGRIDGIVARGQAANRRAWQQRWRTAGCVVGGMLIWSVLPGMAARSLPESWHVPEWMAARTMARDMEAAGEQLLSIARERDQQPSVAGESSAKAESTVPPTRPGSRL